MQHVSTRYLLPPFIVVPPSAAIHPSEQQNSSIMMSADADDQHEDVDHTTKISIDDGNDEAEHDNTRKLSSGCSGCIDDYKVDKMFYKICYFCFSLGVNFYRDRSSTLRCASLILVGIMSSINLYFVGYILYLTLSKPFQADRVATSISMGTWTLQATLSTLFLAYWQYASRPCKVLKLLYEANKGLGIKHHRNSLEKILRTFYVVLALTLGYYVSLIVANFTEFDVGYTDEDIPKIFGDRRLFTIVLIATLYSILCWGVALFIFSLLVHATHYEFSYFNEQVRSLLPKDKHKSSLQSVCGCDRCDPSRKGCNDDSHCAMEYQSDEVLCDYLLKLMKIHNRLTECVKRLDKMFNQYAFVMIATIIPTTLFSLFMVVRSPSDTFCLELLLSCPLVCFCVFSFFALVNGPSRLHNTIYTTKSALCENTHIWFPYRPNVYHSALAFTCHLDQTNLGVSLWGFAVVSKPLVLTTLSVMVTCLALFLQVGECNAGYQPAPSAQSPNTFF